MDETRKVFIENLRKLLELKGVTQKEFADALGLNKQTHNNEGKNEPELSESVRFMRVFGCFCPFSSVSKIAPYMPKKEIFAPYLPHGILIHWLRID